MSSSLTKILETGINFFISNSQIITIKTYYEKSTIYKCGERQSMTIGCNIWMICLNLNWFFCGLSSMLHLSEFVWTLRTSVLVVFNNFLLIDATDRNKISSDQKRFFIALGLCPHSFFANTPFNRLKKIFSCNYLIHYLKG